MDLASSSTAASALPIWNSASAGIIDGNPVSLPPGQVDAKPMLDVNFTNNDLFGITEKVIMENGGPTSPAAVLQAQMEMVSVQMSWLLTSQLASKASSGAQTLFNNSV